MCKPLPPMTKNIGRKPRYDIPPTTLYEQLGLYYAGFDTIYQWIGIRFLLPIACFILAIFIGASIYAGINTSQDWFVVIPLFSFLLLLAAGTTVINTILFNEEGIKRIEKWREDNDW
jgi:energy-coupling factor transporter transmembrane protein EcfT